jgi:deoxyribonucleoside regulator
MTDKYSDEQLRLAARLYYIDGFGQVEIGRLVKVSQAKVSRLLALARERGIVRISVEEYASRNEELEQRLGKALGIRRVAVIKTVAGVEAAEARRMVAHFGAPYVGSLIAPGSVVAIAGGRTMHELVQELPEDRQRGVTVVQAMGSIDANIGPWDALELARTMARRWGGFFVTLNTPAFVPDKKTRDTLLALDQIRSVWQRFDKVNVALVGIGTLDHSVFLERGVLKSGDIKRLRACGVVGEICGRFFDRKGKECDSPWRDRVISIEADQLRKIPEVVGVVAGGQRAEAIAAAIRGGLLKSLLIDELAARELLAPPSPG